MMYIKTIQYTLQQRKIKQEINFCMRNQLKNVCEIMQKIAIWLKFEEIESLAFTCRHCNEAL